MKTHFLALALVLFVLAGCSNQVKPAASGSQSSPTPSAPPLEFARPSTEETVVKPAPIETNNPAVVRSKVGTPTISPSSPAAGTLTEPAIVKLSPVTEIPVVTSPIVNAPAVTAPAITAPAPVAAAPAVAAPIVSAPVVAAPTALTRTHLEPKLSPISEFDAQALLQTATFKNLGSSQFALYPSQKQLNKNVPYFARVLFRVPSMDLLHQVLSIKIKLKNFRIFLAAKSKMDSSSSKICVMPDLCVDGEALTQALGEDEVEPKEIKLEKGDTLYEFAEIEIDLLKLFAVAPEKSAQWIHDHTTAHAEPDYRKLVLSVGPNLFYEGGSIRFQYELKGAVPASSKASNPIHGETDQKPHRVKAATPWIRSNESVANAPVKSVASDLHFAIPGHLLKFAKNAGMMESTPTERFLKMYEVLAAETSHFSKLVITGYSDSGGTMTEAIAVAKHRALGFLSQLTSGHMRWPATIRPLPLTHAKQSHRIEIAISFRNEMTLIQKQALAKKLRASLNAIWK